ncbi:Uncharacterised protein g4415 [Pycnogonum litorale]
MLITFLAIVSGVIVVEAAPPPNIVFIVADDLGWNDVSWHNSEIWSPNLQKLVEQGVELNQYYVQPICTPSRSAFMTGRYPFHIGTQHNVFHPLQNVSVPLSFTLLPELLKKSDYKTHLIGKWHLGYCRWNMTPTYRGFDSFYGYYNGAEDYYTHERICYSAERKVPGRCQGLDFRDDTRVVLDKNGTYSTSIFRTRALQIIEDHPKERPLFLQLSFQAVHYPLQVPERYLRHYWNVEDRARRTYSGMVSALDEAVGDVVDALKRNDLYENTVIVFTTDNGGETLYGGNNWPLRGNKETLWEGGTRGVAFVHSPLLEKRGYVNDELIHAVDWLPTFLDIGRVHHEPSDGIDGISQWKTISRRLRSNRTEFVYNIFLGEDGGIHDAGLRLGKYKLLLGDPGYPDGWIPPKNPSVVAPGDSKSDIYLFDLDKDPLEKVNIAKTNPEIVETMKNRLSLHSKTYVPLLARHEVERGDPKYWHGAFTPGWC